MHGHSPVRMLSFHHDDRYVLDQSQNPTPHAHTSAAHNIDTSPPYTVTSYPSTNARAPAIYNNTTGNCTYGLASAAQCHTSMYIDHNRNGATLDSSSTCSTFSSSSSYSQCTTTPFDLFYVLTQLEEELEPVLNESMWNSLDTRDEDNIRALHPACNPATGTTRMCGTCGLRVKKCNYPNHLDMHFKENTVLAKKKRSRRWYKNNKDMPHPLIDISVSGRDIHPKLQDPVQVLASAGSLDEKERCGTCREMLEWSYDKDLDEWVYLQCARDAHGKVFHVECLPTELTKV